jgi:CheY-like chemotaxis protein
MRPRTSSSPCSATSSGTRSLRSRTRSSPRVSTLPGAAAPSTSPGGGERLGRLIDDLLDVARITQRKIPLRTRRVRLASIVRRAVETTRQLVADHAQTLSVSLADGDAEVDADPERLEQIIVNLVTNAAKYTPSGGRIDLGTGRENQCLVLGVRDNGIGIAPEMLPRVFELFAQGARSLDRAEGGLGIGLTIVRRLVELHGGRVEVRSEGIGKGAQFQVKLPLAPPSAEETALAPAAAEAGHVGGADVMVVEDNLDAAEAVTMLLELLGHHVRVVHDGAAALHAAQVRVPDLMLVDIGLPGMDGYEVARRVRRDAHLKGTLLVALTGYGRDEDKRQSVAAGFDEHLTKPVDPDALDRIVARLGLGRGRPAH